MPRPQKRYLKMAGVLVHELIIGHWAAKYSCLVEQFTRRLRVKTGGDVASADEKYFGSKRKGRWFFYTICTATRFILSFDTADSKFAYDATAVCRRDKTAGPYASHMSTDRPTGFRAGYRNAMNTGNTINTLHVAGASINGKHLNNNIHERCNGDLAALIRCQGV